MNYNFEHKPWTCDICKNIITIANRIGNFRMCGRCLDEIHKLLINSVNKLDLQRISFLEQQVIIEMFLLSKVNNCHFIFQEEIVETTSGCKWKLADLNGTAKKPFRCTTPNSSKCEQCDLHFENYFVKYVLDFVIITSMGKEINIEVDGLSFHNNEYDSIRDNYMKNRGYKVLRFTYDEIINERSQVFKKIENEIKNEQI